MNAAISSSVVLASRLSDDLSVFGLILFSVQLFALFPMLRRRMQVCWSATRVCYGLQLTSFIFVPTGWCKSPAGGAHDFDICTLDIPHVSLVEHRSLHLYHLLYLCDAHRARSASLGAEVQEVCAD